MTKAIRFDRIGGPEVLQYQDVNVGEPGPGQVRVRHTYIALNFIDIYFRTGRDPLDLPNGLGSDAVGVVEAVGPDVDYVKPGDRVGYLIGPQGAYSQARVMPAGRSCTMARCHRAHSAAGAPAPAIPGAVRAHGG